MAAGVFVLLQALIDVRRKREGNATMYSLSKELQRCDVRGPRRATMGREVCECYHLALTRIDAAVTISTPRLRDSDSGG